MNYYSAGLEGWRAISLAAFENHHGYLERQCASGGKLDGEESSQLMGAHNSSASILSGSYSRTSLMGGSLDSGKGILSSFVDNLIDLFSEDPHPQPLDSSLMKQQKQQQQDKQFNADQKHLETKEHTIVTSLVAADRKSRKESALLSAYEQHPPEAIELNGSRAHGSSLMLDGSAMVAQDASSSSSVLLRRAASLGEPIKVTGSQFVGGNSPITSDLLAVDGPAGFSSGASNLPEAANLTSRSGSSSSSSSSTSTGSSLSSSVESPYQLEALGERWQIFLIVLYSLTAITSFILNLLTVIVLARCRRSELRKYLINLSMSDLLMSLFSIPFTYTEYMLGRWVFFESLCPIVRSVVILSVFVSASTMTVIGINRHLAIMNPLRRRNFSRFQRLFSSKERVIGTIWLLGIAISTPEFRMYKTEPFCYNRILYYECRQILHPEHEIYALLYTVCLYLSTFAIPLSLLSYLYLQICLKLWRQKMPGNVHVNRDLAMQNKRAKSIKMLCMVVIMFAVSWLPLQTFSLLLYVLPQLRDDFEYESLGYYIFVGAYFACHWLSTFHSCLNPLIYCFMNDKFRTNLQTLLCTHKRAAVLSVPCQQRARKVPPPPATTCPDYYSGSTGAGDQRRSTLESLPATELHSSPPNRLLLLARTLQPNHTSPQSVLVPEGVTCFGHEQPADKQLDEQAELDELELELADVSERPIQPVQV